MTILMCRCLLYLSKQARNKKSSALIHLCSIEVITIYLGRTLAKVFLHSGGK